MGGRPDHMGPHVRGPVSPQPACLQLCHQLLRSRSAIMLCCAVLCCAALCCAALCCAMVLLASNAAVHAGLRYAWPAIISLTVNCSSQLGSTCDSVNMMCSNSCCCCAGGREAKHFASTKFTFLGRRAPPQRRDRFCSNITIDLVGIVALETQLCCVSQVRSGSMQVTSLSR